MKKIIISILFLSVLIGLNVHAQTDVNIRYLKSQGKGEIYSKNGLYLTTHSNWRTSWQNIVKYGGLHLFYDRTAGIGEVYSFDQQNINRLVKSYPNWRRSWDIVTTCPAGILFYEPTGYAETYSLGSDGSMSLKKTYNGWRSSWKNMVMIDCDRSLGDDVCAASTMLFYDPIAHTGEFWNMSADGNMVLKKTHTNFRSTWKNIVALDNGKVLFYDRTNNLIEIYYADGQGNLSLRKSYPNWEKPLTDITFLSGGILFTTTNTNQLVKYKVTADGALTKIQ